MQNDIQHVLPRFFDHFSDFFYLNGKKVRALRYPLFCLLGHAPRLLWNPKPQLDVNYIFFVDRKVCIIIINRTYIDP